MSIPILQTEILSGVATLTLNRPESKNALNPELISKLKDEVQKLSRLTEVRVLVIKGAGTVFCAGADLKNMQSMINFTLEENKSDAEVLFSMFQVFADCPKPIVTVIQGAAYGGALGFLAVSDVTLVEEKTQFYFSEVKLGISPAIISHFLLHRFNVGQLSALMTSGKIFSATEASKLNLITEVFKGSSEAALNTWTQAFKDAGPEAIAATKNLLRAIPLMSQDESHKLVVKTLAERRVSAEGQEGLKAFFEKRNPAWRNS